MSPANYLSEYFEIIGSLPDPDICSWESFQVLSRWCERQPWWPEFLTEHGLDQRWRRTSLATPNRFALAVFRFQMRLYSSQ